MVVVRVRSDLVFAREINKLLILDCLRHRSPVSRTQITSLTGLNKATVSNLMEDILAEGLAVELGQAHSTGGRKPVLLLFNQEAAYAIGLEVGVNYLVCVICNLAGHTVWIKRTTEAFTGTEQIVRRIEQTLREAVAHAPESRYGLLGIGIGVPGIVDFHKGLIIDTPNLPIKDLSLADILGLRFELPVFVDNDANCAALGEYVAGVGRGCANFVYLSAGMGLGSGIFIDGRLYRGSGGLAGELGHTAIEQHGLRCACGNYGCWEMYASERALHRLAEQNGLADGEASGANIVERLVDLAARGDVRAIACFESIGAGLGVGVSNIINAFNPSLIILGNTLAQAGHWILNPLNKLLSTRWLPADPAKVKIALSDLGQNACAVGGASQVIENSLPALAGRKTSGPTPNRPFP